MLLIVSVCLLAVYFLTPVLLNEVAEGLIREDKLVKADVIIAFAGDHRCNREKRAAELYHQGWANNVVVSGISYAWGFHTGEAAQVYVMSLGVPEEKISMISETRNTRTEARALDDLMRERGWNSAIIVTSAFHSRRAMYTVERAAPGRTFYSSPVPTGSPEWTPQVWWSRRGDVYLTVREFASWANTLVGGWHGAISKHSAADKYVADLYRRGMARKIVCVGSQVSRELYPGDYVRESLISQGVPPEDVISLRLPIAPCGGAHLPKIVEFVKANGWRRALYVTHPEDSRYSDNLARRFFEREGIALAVSYSPEDREELTRNWWRTHWKTQRIVAEAMIIALDRFYSECR